MPFLHVSDVGRGFWSQTLGVRAVWFLLLGFVVAMNAVAQEPPIDAAKPDVPAIAKDQESVAAAPKSPVAKYLTVTNPVTDTFYNRVRNSLVALQQQATQENRQAILILELERGRSIFGPVREIAKELTSAKYQRVKTVAWIPSHSEGRRLDGCIGILALACQEIVMHPDAEFGDLGSGAALDADEQQFVINMVEKRYNSKLTGSIAASLVDPAKSLHKVRTGTKDAATPDAQTTRLIGSDELKRLQEGNVPILSLETIKEQRDIAVFTGARAKSLDIIVSHTAHERSELVDLFGFERQYLREDIGTGEVPITKIIKVEGMVNPFLREFVERNLQQAEKEGANLVILEIDSPGGYVHDSVLLADRLSKLDPKKMRTVAYVPHMAISGAAVIALGCDDIIMHQDAQLGDAGMIKETEAGGQFEFAPEKQLSPLRESLRRLATAKGRSPALCESMSAKDLQVFKATKRDSGSMSYMTDAEIQNSEGEWIKGAPVPECGGGQFLTVAGKRAYELRLASEPVHDFSELKQRLGIPKDKLVPIAQTTWVDTLVSVLRSPAVTFLLFMIGILCLYLEAHTTSGIFAIGAIFSFGLFFWANYMGGTAGWLEVMLFLIGAGLVAIEVFLIPGFGVFGLSGGLAIIASIVLASQTFVVPSTNEEFRQLAWSMGTLSSSIVAVGFVALILGRFLPHIPGIRNMILAPPGDDGPMLDPRLINGSQSSLATSHDQELVGQAGVAYSSLRPAGKAQFKGRLVDVVSNGDFIDPGTPIEVVEVSGNRIVVCAK